MRDRNLALFRKPITGKRTAVGSYQGREEMTPSRGLLAVA